MADATPRKPYFVVVLVILAVLVVVIAKTTTKQKPAPEPQPQTAQAPDDNPVLQTARAVPPDSTNIAAPQPASAPASESAEEPAPEDAAAQDPDSEPGAPPQPAVETPAPQKQPDKEVELLPGSRLAQCLRNGRPTLVDFGAGWCKPCQMQDPILRETAAKYEGVVDVVYVNTDDYPEIARQYRVSAIPAQFVFDSAGVQVATHIGVWPADEIDQALAAAGGETSAGATK